MTAKGAQKRLALIIASYEYQDDSLRQLVAPAQDAEALARVLRNPDIGDFQVQTLLNEPAYKVSRSIEAFFINRKRDDLLLLYFSGHGIKDDWGRLYFATADTRRSTPRTTAIPASLVNGVMTDSRSRRQVLLLDCCYSGAFARTKADQTVGVQGQVGGRGRVVLTSSDAVQYSFEGDEVTGGGVRSVFTSALVQGLETGEADRDRDGYISLDELYEYVYERVVDETPKQRPQMFATVEGKIVVARNPALSVPKSVLPGMQREVQLPSLLRKTEQYKVLSPDRILWKKDGKEMVCIPAGKFLCGDEKETRELPEFWIDKTLVTNTEYARFVKVTGHEPPQYWKGKTPPKDIADHPVMQVAWHDAVAYVKWAGKRLPTEEEWEKAARGTDGREYPWGDWTEGLCNTEDAGIGTTTPVGLYSPNGDSSYGCVDMAGNVWEWTSSEYEAYPGSRVMRGGSYFNEHGIARCASRYGRHALSSLYNPGFRCVSPISLS